MVTSMMMMMMMMRRYHDVLLISKSKVSYWFAIIFVIVMLRTNLKNMSTIFTHWTLQESAFAMVNKHALEGTLAFVSALASSESLPTEMKTDVGHIQRLLMADTDQWFHWICGGFANNSWATAEVGRAETHLNWEIENWDSKFYSKVYCLFFFHQVKQNL